MDRSVDFYRPTILPDPSLRVLERRGIWGLGGGAILAMVLVLAALLRLDHLGHDPLGPVETAIWRDWNKTALELPGIERREILPPLYQHTLRFWAGLFPSHWMMRFHSTIWALVLIILAFRLGTVYFNPQTGAFCAALLAVSPVLVATSQDIGSATEAAVFLAINLVCLVGIIFRRPSGFRWALYALTGVMATLCHPVAIWVVLIQAMAAIGWGPREERRGFYGRMVGYLFLIALFGWAWFRMTRPVDLSWQPDWHTAERVGLFGLIRLLGAVSFWGTRLFPQGWLWTLGSILLVAFPIIYGSLSIRQRRVQDLAGFFLLCGVLPPIVILLGPTRLIGLQDAPTATLVMTLVPLALWAAVSIRSGLRGTTRQVLVIALLGGGLVFTWLSSRVVIGPNWAELRKKIEICRRKGETIVESRINRLADYKQQIGLQRKDLRRLLALRPNAEKTVTVLEALLPPYLAVDRPASIGPLVRGWLEKNCKPAEMLDPAQFRFFRLTRWTEFDPVALRREINHATFLDPKSWETLRFVSGFGPYDPGFDSGGTYRRIIQVQPGGALGRTLVRSHTQWIFKPKLPPDYYHVYIPLKYTGEGDQDRQILIWSLPDGSRKKQTVSSSTNGFSFLWEPLAPGEPLKIGLVAPGYHWRPRSPANPGKPPVLFRGVGLRRHFPYTVDIGAPFDDLALGRGWHPPQQEGELTYRATEAVSELTMYLPMAGAISLDGELLLRVCQRHPAGKPLLPFEVEWDGKGTTGETLATKKWKTIRVKISAPPAPGRHTIVIKSQVYKVARPDDPNRSERFGILVDRITIK